MEFPGNKNFPPIVFPKSTVTTDGVTVTTDALPIEIWAWQYMRHRFKDEDYNLVHSPQMHREFAYLWSHPIEYPKVIYVAPRGYSKSTWGELGVLFDAIAGGPSYFKEHLIIKASEELAKKTIQSIKDEITNNDLLVARYGELSTRSDREKRWSALECNLRNGVVIQGRGRGGSMRGLHPNSTWPDDLEKEGDTGKLSAVEIEGIDQWLRKSVIPMILSKRGRIFFTGNILQYGSVLHNMLMGKGWPENWYRVRYGARLENGHSAWPERFPDEILAAKEADMGYAEFRAEMMNDPLGSLNPLVLREDLQYFEEHELPPYTFKVLGFDPACSIKTHNDFSAFVLIGTDTSQHKMNERYFVIDAGQGHWDLTERVNKFFSLYRQYRPDVIRIEATSFQMDFKNHVEMEARRTGINLPIEPVWPGKKGSGLAKDKYTRLDALTPMIRLHKVFFRKDQTELIEQLLTFPSAPHDDLVDAFTYGLDAMKTNWMVIDRNYQKMVGNYETTPEPVFSDLGM